MAELALLTKPWTLLRNRTTALPVCPLNMGTDLRENNIINPPPQRMVHHTNHDKEYTCLLKGKKCTFLFFICFKKFDQVARKRLGTAMYTRAGHRAVKAAGLHSSPWVLWPRALRVTATARQAWPVAMSPELRPRVPLSRAAPARRAHQPCVLSLGLASPSRRTGSRPPGPGRLALSDSNRQAGASVTAALTSSPSGS